MFVLKRSKHNPIIQPVRQHRWESFATFNWSPLQDGDTLHCLYRAMSLPEAMKDGSVAGMSVVGYAKSRDGVEFEDRRILVEPEEEWEKYGCEDPRITKIDGKHYIFIQLCLSILIRLKVLK